MSGEWIEWKGGECPVAPGAIVQVQFREDDESGLEPQTAGPFRWTHNADAPTPFGDGLDIIAYRIVKP